MYSVERFYEAPLVSSIECQADSTVALLNFTAHNNFKMNHRAKGTYRVFGEGANTLKGDRPLLEGDFYFAAHWRDTVVSVDVSDAMNEDGTVAGSVAVINQ